MSRLQRAAYHWREGRRYGYPACCIAHFCLDALAGWQAAPVRHNPNDRDGEPGVVCGVVHRGQSPLPLHRRLAEIVSWQSIYVRPGARGRAFRSAIRLYRPS